MNRSLKIVAPLLAAVVLTPIIWWLWTLTTSTTSGSSASKPNSKAPAPSAKSVVNDILTRAAATDSRRDAFTALLQSVATSFQEIQPGTTFGQSQWQHITLNKSGAKIDAIRFTVPTDQSRELDWAYLYPKGLKRQWGIRAVNGNTKGMSDHEKPSVSSFTELPKTRFKPAIVLQNFPSDQLTPGQEYLIWFKFQTTDPVEMMVALDLVPPQSNSSISAALGLK